MYCNLSVPKGRIANVGFLLQSNSMAASRRSIATALSPPLVREESIAEHNELPQEIRPAAVEVGDVNIQFPDTLVNDARITKTSQLLISG